MDRKAISQRISEIDRQSLGSEWRGKTYREYWTWLRGELAPIEELAQSEEDKDWLRDALLPIYAGADDDGLMDPEAGFTSVIGQGPSGGSFEERYGLKRAVADELIELRQASQPHEKMGKTYRQFWNWYWAEEERIEAMASLPGELDKIKVELLDIRSSFGDWGMEVDEDELDEVIRQPYPVFVPTSGHAD